MSKFIIMWSTGGGENYKVISADSMEEAQDIAYEEWYQNIYILEDSEWGAFEYTKKRAADFGIRVDEE